ncbi:membrane protein [Streptomyces sp. NRRL F-5126]|uniref:membrane protein n=1 Tax=Streptomyces sp. NRRL F-5126 TaxID=1463857 RepID=UPI0004C97D48|nr:membrane protein [Streptomyces sp. NRRL F-5126]
MGSSASAPASDRPPGTPGFVSEVRDSVNLRGFLLVVGALLLQLAFIVSYIGAFHAPSPHRIPIAVAAPRQKAQQTAARLDSLPGSPLKARTVAGQAEARQEILRRDVDAALVVDPRSRTDTLLVASADGPPVAAAVEQVVRKVESSQHRGLRTRDIRAPSSRDSRGLASFYLVIGWMVGGYLAASILAVVAGARPSTLHRTVIRLIALALYAVASGLGGAIIAGPVLHALPGHFAQLWAVGALTVFAAAAVTVALQVLLGVLGIGVAILLFVVIGNPSAGGAYPYPLLPPFWRTVGPYIPTGAATNAVRNIVYFSGNAVTGPLCVLGAYAFGGIVLSVVLSAVIRRRPPRAGG